MIEIKKRVFLIEKIATKFETAARGCCHDSLYSVISLNLASMTDLSSSAFV